MKIVVDRVKCTGLGLCEAAAPDIFEIDEDGDLILHSEDVTADQVEAVKAAVRGCPTDALKLIED